MTERRTGVRLTYLQKIFLILTSHIKFIIKYTSQRNILSVYFTSIVNLLIITKMLTKSSLTLVKNLTDICIVDYPQKIYRFEILYNLLSITYNFRLFIIF
jgi:NADH:ubiquinone oxidoreductase subunit C